MTTYVLYESQYVHLVAFNLGHGLFNAVANVKTLDLHSTEVCICSLIKSRFINDQVTLSLLNDRLLVRQCFIVVPGSGCFGHVTCETLGEPIVQPFSHSSIVQLTDTFKDCTHASAHDAAHDQAHTGHHSETGLICF